jgi:hypothetical protein
MIGEDALTEWLVSTLEADATLMGMLNGAVSPEVTWGGNASPFVRIDRLDGEDLMSIGLYRVWVDTQYHIRGCVHWDEGGRPDRTEVNAIGERIDTLLHDKEAVTAPYHFHSFREEPEPLPAVTEPNGELWLQSGGLYRVRVSAA